MAGITGQGTTYNLPNYTGDLFNITPEDTPFLSAIGGLTGGRDANGSPEFEWQFYDLRNAGQNTRVEGAAAPTAEERVRSNESNILQIHQETVETTYTKNAANNVRSGLNIGGVSVALQEQSWQVMQMVKQIARDVEYSFIQGVYAKPADNTTARKTRGILAAITTNAVVNATPAALTEDMLLDAMELAWASGGLQETETRTIMVNSFQKRQLTRIFVTDKNYREESRNVGGVNLTTIETDFGRANIMLNRHMPADQVAIVSLEDCAPRFLPIPNKGHFFQEELAKVGASERTQLYGEIGLEYGNQRKHAKITGLTTA